MRFASLGSGSRGNALVVQAEDTCVLLDCGLGVRHIIAGLVELGLALEDLDAIFITHEHADHIKGVRSLQKKCGVPVYMTYGTAVAGKCLDLPMLKVLEGFEAVVVGDLGVQPIAVPHDAREPCQFIVSQYAHSNSMKLGLLTDLGSFTPHIISAYAECDAVVLECNHDEEKLEQGPYPYSLKQRVRGDWGHLSNTQASQLLASFDSDKLQWIVIAHISQKNNSDALARQALEAVFPYRDRIVMADQESGFPWLELA